MTFSTIDFRNRKRSLLGYVGLQEFPVGDRVLRTALDSYVVLATAESQGRMEVEHALKFSKKLADGTLLGSSLADANGPCDSASLGTTLFWGKTTRARTGCSSFTKSFDILCQL